MNVGRELLGAVLNIGCVKQNMLQTNGSRLFSQAKGIENIKLVMMFFNLRAVAFSEVYGFPLLLLFLDVIGEVAERLSYESDS